MNTARFGAQRLVRPEGSVAERLLFRLLGVADPAHYLHYRYLRRALALAEDPTPRRILDAGCGSGDHTFYLAKRFPAAEVVGVDVDGPRIARNREIAPLLGVRNVRFEVQDLARFGWERQFDLVISIDVLEHILDQKAAIRSLFRALQHGGRFFFHIPTVRRRPVPLSRWLDGFHAWAAQEHIAEERTADEFVGLVRAAGFDVAAYWRTFGFFTGEMATSLFVLPYERTVGNRLLQGVLAPVCRVLALADPLSLETERYAVAVTGRRP